MADRLNVIDISQRNAAKVAAIACLISFPFVVYANFGLRGPLFVTGDIAETVRRIAAAAPVFRLSVAFDIVYCTGVVVLLAALYVVLSPVNRYLALLASLGKFVYAVTGVLMALNFLTIMHIASDAQGPVRHHPELLAAVQGVARRMTRTTNARIAGVTFLVYIAAGIASMVLFARATSGAGVAAPAPRQY